MVTWAFILALTVLGAEVGPAVEPPSALLNARRLTQELRFEEAVVEYQRYLSVPSRPETERALALVELGFVHSLLGDETSARARALEGLELNPQLVLPPDAAAKLKTFVSQMREELERRVRLEMLPQNPDAPEQVRVNVTDKAQRTKQVLLRHSLSPKGPFYAAPMTCREQHCQGQIPPLSEEAAYSAWYFVEAQDADGSVLARLNGPQNPAQTTVVRRTAWYRNPWIWGGTAAALLTAGAVVFLVSPAPPAR